LFALEGGFELFELAFEALLGGGDSVPLGLLVFELLFDFSEALVQTFLLDLKIIEGGGLFGEFSLEVFELALSVGGFLLQLGLDFFQFGEGFCGGSQTRLGGLECSRDRLKVLVQFGVLIGLFFQALGQIVDGEFLGTDLFLEVDDLEHGLGLVEEDEPSPFLDVEVGTDVALDGLSGLGLGGQFVVGVSGEITTGTTLNIDEELSDLRLALFFDFGELSGTEEDLGQTNSVLLLVDVQLGEDVLGLGTRIRGITRDVLREQVVSLDEFGEDDAVGETLARDTDAFQDTIASELFEDGVGLDLTGLLGVVGQDATDKVGVGGKEGVHEVVELLAMLEAYGDELGSLLLGGRGAATSRRRRSIDLRIKLFGEQISDGLNVAALDAELDIIGQRIFVLLEPAIGCVFDLSGVMSHGEDVDGLVFELGFVVQRIAFVVTVEFGRERFVCALGEKGFFVESDQDTVGFLRKKRISFSVLFCVWLVGLGRI
jgi:hypothetical protein